VLVTDRLAMFTPKLSWLSFVFYDRLLQNYITHRGAYFSFSFFQNATVGMVYYSILLNARNSCAPIMRVIKMRIASPTRYISFFLYIYLSLSY
jgi:hypothetical protein